MGLTDEDLVEQIKEDPYLQFFIGLKAFQETAPFDPSMMVYFRKRLPEAVVNDCNERIVRDGHTVIQSETAEEPDEDQGPVGDSESEVFWAEFVAHLKERALAGVKLVISDTHSGLTKAIRLQLQGSVWQRCRVHFARNLLQCVPKAHQGMVTAAWWPAPKGDAEIQT